MSFLRLLLLELFPLFTSSILLCRMQEDMQAHISTIPLQWDGQGFQAQATWSSLSEEELLTRMVLTEMGSQLLTSAGVEDAIGVIHVALNRTRGGSGFRYGYGSVHSIILQSGQFPGMYGVLREGRIVPGNARYAADPVTNYRWYGSQEAGRQSYWIARALAHCILMHAVPDPTHGALYFSSAYIDERGVFRPYADGRVRFRMAQGSMYLNALEIER